MLCKRSCVPGAVRRAASLAAPAQQPQPGPQPNADAARRSQSHPRRASEQLRASPIQGLYEFTRGVEIAYVTSDGKYAITGDLYDLGANDDLTETHRREVRMQLMAPFLERDGDIWSEGGGSTPSRCSPTWTVATCRKLHSEIASIQPPRGAGALSSLPAHGPNTSSWSKAEQVWCSVNRNEALTRAKLGQELHGQALCQQPVARSWRWGGICVGRNPPFSWRRLIAARYVRRMCSPSTCRMRPPSSRGVR